MLVVGALAGATMLSPTLHADTYTVQPGDTLSGIAQDYGVSTGVLRILNPSVSSDDLLFAGQVLSIPDNAHPNPDADEASGVPYTVQPGNTLSGIATVFGVTQAQLLALNPTLDPNLLFAGALLILPAGAQASTPTTTPTPAPTPAPQTAPLSSSDVIPYLVQPGDTYSGLAERFGSSVAGLFALNPRVPPGGLLAGAVIFVPRQEGTPGTSPPRVTIPTLPYTVQPADSASGVALSHGVGLDGLRAANPGLNLDTIFIGQTLRVPIGRPAGDSPPPVAATPSEIITYVVRPGDIAYGIAARLGVPFTLIVALNPSIDLNIIHVGDILNVPNVVIPPPPPGSVPAGHAPNRTYTVESGDTLTAIAAQFRTVVPGIVALNAGINANLLLVGQVLRVPGTIATPEVARTAVTGFGDALTYVAADLGVLPHTLLANNPGLSEGFIPAGISLRVPNREGILVTVQAGDTLAAIAAARGSSVTAISGDPRSGVSDPNGLIIGQEIIVPITVPNFIWPVTGPLTDGFGVCRTSDCSLRHGGVDIGQAGNPGGPVLAIAPGVVTFTGGSFCCGLGIHVEIEHANGWISRYAHLMDIPPVGVGDQVAGGQIIGRSGTTGFSTGVHLHLELEHNGWALDALNYLP